jgi:hypothetical protein
MNTVVPFRPLHPREADERRARKQLIAKSEELQRELKQERPFPLKCDVATELKFREVW